MRSATRGGTGLLRNHWRAPDPGRYRAGEGARSGGSTRRDRTPALDGGAVPDQPEVLAATLARAAEQADVVVTTGGDSIGDEDHMPRLVRELGGEIHAMKIAIKPGKPLTLGRLGEALYIGLPGNPVAVFVAMAVVGSPILCRRMIPFPAIQRFCPGHAIILEHDPRSPSHGSCSISLIFRNFQVGKRFRFPRNCSSVVHWRTRGTHLSWMTSASSQGLVRAMASRSTGPVGSYCRNDHAAI